MTEPTAKLDQERPVIVSSDGHACARMEDYRPYLPEALHERFDAFFQEYKLTGSRSFERKTLSLRLDEDVIAAWERDVLEPGRWNGVWDVHARQAELDQQGIAAEVLFPDFGLPFEMYTPLHSALVGYEMSHEEREASNRAYNRWLADFCSAAPERLVGSALLSFEDVGSTLEEIRWARDAGLKGVVLPMFGPDRPVFDPQFEPVWDLLEDLEMPVNCHATISSVTRADLLPGLKSTQLLPDPAVVMPVITAQVFFYAHQLLSHFIWGGILERHPRLQLVLTEMGSGWVVGALKSMDYSFEGSYLRRDVRNVLKSPPSEYFARQCHLGSSLFSRAEAEARHEIGVDKMTIGSDYPHFEGTWAAGPGQTAWLQATLGMANVPAEDARKMLGLNAVALWDLDAVALTELAQKIAPPMTEILEPKSYEAYPRGDVRKPLATAF